MFMSRRRRRGRTRGETSIEFFLKKSVCGVSEF